MSGALSSFANAAAPSGPPAPIPVLFCIPCLGTGGAERQLTLLLKTLDRRRVSPSLALFQAEGGLHAEALTIPDLPVHVLDDAAVWSKRKLPIIQWRLARLARRSRVGVLYSYLPLVNTMALAAARLAGAGCVWSLRGSDTPWRDYSLGLAAVFRWEGWLSGWADAVVANSRVGADWHMDHGYSRRTMRVIRNGVDASRFAPDAAAGRAFRAAHGIPPDAPVLGQVGRFDPQKDWPVFLQAAARAVEATPALRLLCVGRPQTPWFQDMQRLARELGLAERAVFTGEVLDMPGAYNAMDVCALSSAYGEGVPNALAEAMACGVPCVTTRVGDGPWLLDDPARTAPPGDAEALARILLALPWDDRRALATLGEQDRRRATEELSLTRLAEEVTTTVESVARRRAHTSP